MEALRRETDLEIKKIVQPKPKDGDSNFYELSLSIAEQPEGKTRRFDFAAKIERRLTNLRIGEAALTARRTSKNFVLVTEYISTQQAGKLREMNVCFFDAAGNAYLRAQNLYIYITGKKTEAKKEKPIKLFRAAGLKLLFYFLTEPGTESLNYREIEKQTGTPRATVGEIMKDLKQAGFLVSRGVKKRSIIRKDELLKRWVEGYGEQLRPKLLLSRFKSDEKETRWWEEIDIKDYQAEWGGEVAGGLLTDHLKPELVTIYADSVLPKLQLKGKLRRSDKGEVEILKRFWKRNDNSVTAPPLVVYADLMATADRRNLETAQIIYDRYLADFTKTAS